jgi:RNA polymerase sigma-70 factor, ECF subfamily
MKAKSETKVNGMRLEPNAEVPKRPLLYADLSSLSDEDLMVRLREGHHDALAVLFDRYHRMVMSVALRILRNAAEAEDLTQSVFLEIFRSMAKFDAARGTVKVWILQYAYHRGFNRRQYLNLRGFYERSDDFATDRRSHMAGNATSLGMIESAQVAQQALKQLNKAQRRTLELAFYEGLTMHEIAAKDGESFDSVRHNYYRGLEKLRLLLCDATEARLKSSYPKERIPHVQP